jgi:peptide/nickel transport system ATP-binding protein
LRDILLRISDLSVEFRTDEGTVRALDGIELEIPRGKTIGIVGESGCGKSVTALSIMRLIQSPPGRLVSGTIEYDGQNLLALPERSMRKLRGNRISMIFQEPMTSLNPVLTIGDQIAEAVRLHQGFGKKQSLLKAQEMLGLVGIPSPAERVHSYPHQLSGGMRQRVMIAMALSCKPDLLIADEPTTALDVTIQAQIMELMKSLQESMGMSIMLITHDLGVVAETCDEVVVMYAGRVVEKADVRTIFRSPKHPYTFGLLSSIPSWQGARDIDVEHGKKTRLRTIPGLVPNLLHLPTGCRFQDRCLRVKDDCRKSEPALEVLAQGQAVRCFYPHSDLNGADESVHPAPGVADHA